MSDERVRPGVWIGVSAFLAILALVVVLAERNRAPAPREPEADAPSAPSQPVSLGQEGEGVAPGGRSERPSVAARSADAEAVPYIEGLVWGDIDLREAKVLMPDNIYWELGAPTKDPAVLEARDAERRRRNQEYGRVLAGDASEDQVRAYYDYRTHVSRDYLEFAEFMRRRFSDSANEEFLGLLDLSVKMHSARLAQIPGDLEASLERGREQMRLREEWKKQQEEFGGAAPGDAGQLPD